MIVSYKEKSVDTAVFSEKESKKQQTVVISSENEEAILSKLQELEKKNEYLRIDFNQQYVAKKIKSNTSYLSFVVNKHYGKSFSNYYTEKRINYAINKIVNDSKFREYTTQAIAESVGFKNADSFATSFKKKTGVTPFQFITEVKKVS
jgi:AraC-like DNA-binding protein